MVEKIIGKRIQYFRKQKGLTQEQLAEAVGITTNYLSAVERGVYQVKFDTLVQIMNEVDCTADDLFGEVLNCGYKIKSSRLSDEMAGLSASEQSLIFDVVEAMIKNMKK